MDTFVQCHYCKQTPTDPLELLCRHSYCSKCITTNIQNNKVICPVCGTEHMTPAASLAQTKADKLVPYLIGLHSGEPYTTVNEATPTIQADCSECKKAADLRTCFHCNKPLCVDCRTKHSDTQKKVVDESHRELEVKIGKCLELARALNVSRTNRIDTYKHMKEQVASQVKELKRFIEEEELRLQKQIDTRIGIEDEKIQVTQREIDFLKNHKGAIDKVADKHREQEDPMVLTKMHTEYLAIVPLWKEKLETQAARLNPKNEEELKFEPRETKKDEALVGKLHDSKDVRIQASSSSKKMATHADHSHPTASVTKSGACTIM